MMHPITQCSQDDNLLIRQATRKDLEYIGDLWIELITYHSKLDARFTIPEGGRSHYIRHIYNALRDDNYRVLVAEIEKRVIGYIIGYIAENPPIFPQKRYGFIADLCITASCRRCGAGTALVSTIKHWFIARGLYVIQLNVAHNNPVSQQFWRDIGCTDYLDHMWMKIDEP